MLKIILIAYGLTAIIEHGTIFEKPRCYIAKRWEKLYHFLKCYQCLGFWSGLVVSLLLGQGWVSILYGFATSGICELTDIVIKKIENMTDYEFQLQNERNELKATINGLRDELKQRAEAYDELSAMFQDCQKKLDEALQREEIAKKAINEKRKEIEQKYDEHDRQIVVDFMDYLNKRDFFRDDLCFDCEHQALTYLELRKK